MKSKLASGNARRLSVSFRTYLHFLPWRLYRSASSSIDGAISTPVTSSKCSASVWVSLPTPHPKSSALCHRRVSPRDVACFRAAVISASPVWKNSSGSHLFPFLLGHVTIAQSGSTRPNLSQLLCNLRIRVVNSALAGRLRKCDDRETVSSRLAPHLLEE